MKKKTPKRGYLLHAFGHKDLDYGKLAVCCALSIKTHLKENHITVVMDEGTNKWIKTSIHNDILKKSFDNIIISNERFRSGKRRHYDSPWVNFKAEFNNQNRILSYQYSPYEETILVDVDFLVMNDSFDQVWGNNEDMLMNCKAIDFNGNTFGSIDEQRLSPYGISMYWATVVYFKKTKYTKSFFDLVEYIRDEYNFFQFLYEFKKSFYRNDFSYSIAAHIMSGYNHAGIKPLPEDTLLSSYQQDAIAEVLQSNQIIFLANDVKKPWVDTIVNVEGMNVHIMNKRELLRVSDEYIDLCMEKL